MNIIYHRNCLDGVFASFIAYLFTKLIDEDEFELFINYFKQNTSKEQHNLASHPPQPQHKTYQIFKEEQKINISQDFFHTPTPISANAFSFFAGEYYPLAFPGPKKLLLILDTNLVSAENIKDVCKTHELVIMIDHHTSFKSIQKDNQILNLSNFYYLFDESDCAARLTYHFFNSFFPFSHKLNKQYLQTLQQQLCYVSANDTKQNETKQSKTFVLGFYYFDIELSHNNPNLYKRIGMLDIQYLMVRGSNLYEHHLQEIADEVNHAKVLEILKGTLKNKKCLYLEPRNPRKISDIGIVMAYLSVKHQMENLAILAINNSYEIRLSCRSHKQCKEPRALQLASQCGGGGHTEAAGFKMSSNSFRGQFKTQSTSNVGIHLTLSAEDVQEILLIQTKQ